MKAGSGQIGVAGQMTNKKEQEGEFPHKVVVFKILTKGSKNPSKNKIGQRANIKWIQLFQPIRKRIG